MLRQANLSHALRMAKFDGTGFEVPEGPTAITFGGPNRQIRRDWLTPASRGFVESALVEFTSEGATTCREFRAAGRIA
jgi:hypothetical protein